MISQLEVFVQIILLIFGIQNHGGQGVGHQPRQQQVRFLLYWAIEEHEIGHEEHGGAEDDDDQVEAEGGQGGEVEQQGEGDAHTVGQF